MMDPRRLPRPAALEIAVPGSHVAVGRSARLDALGEPHDAQAAPLHTSESDRSLERLAPWILGALIAVGALLRLIDLGQLSFRWDEDLSSLAAKAIAEHGVPELPSGMIYLRSLPFLYVLAGSGALFGFDEWGLRLPAALFGITLIALAYVFAKRLFGTGVGLVAAALVTLSAWDIEFSRYARMYAPFAVFYVLTLSSIWRHLIVRRSTAGGLLCLAFALVALLLHDLAYTLAFAFLLPLLIRGKETLEDPRSAVFPLVGCVTVAVGFFAWGRIQGYYFNRAAILAAEGGVNTAAVPGDLTLRAVEQTQSGPGGPLDLIARIITQLRLPDLPAFSALLDTLPLAAAALPLLAVAGAAAFIAVRRPILRPAAYALVPAIALLCGLQLFNVALLAILTLAFVRREGVRAFRSAEVVFASGLFAVFFAVWLAATVGLDLLGVDGRFAATAKEAIQQLLNYPSFFVFWGFPKEFPFAAIPAVIGGLWAFDRIARPKPDPAALFLTAAFALPILLNGMFETRYQNFRYNVPFTTLFFTFVAIGIVKWREVAASWRGAGDSREPVPAARRLRFAVTALLVALVAGYDVNPAKSWLVTQREYWNEGELYAFFDLRSFRDYRTAADFVGARADANDTLITFDCREYFNYLDRMDYCLVSRTYRSGDDLIQTYVGDDGMLKDLYVGSTMILSAEDLERVLAESPGDAWLLASDAIFEDEGGYDEEMVEFLAARQEHVVHVARDGLTKVYRF